MQAFKGFLSALDWSSRVLLGGVDEQGMTVASRLRAARRFAGFSRPRLASLIGINRVTVWRYELQELASIPRDTLERWAAECHVPASWIESGKSPAPSALSFIFGE